MSTSVAFGYARVLSDPPQDLLDSSLEGLKSPLADPCTNIEKHDLLVDRIDVFRLSGTLVRPEASPAKERLAGYVHEPRTAHVCPECRSVYPVAGQHPENGCKLGAVEDVLSL